MIPQDFIDDLLRQTDIVEFIDSYVPLKKRGSSYLACCPFHNEKNPSFNVIAKKQFYHCFGCGASGNAISFAMEYLKQAFPEAVNTLALRAGLTVPKEQQENKSKPQNSLYNLLAQITKLYQKDLQNSLGKKARDYLQKRDVSPETIQKYQLGYAPAEWHYLESHKYYDKTDLINSGMLVKNDEEKIYDRYRDRLMFPIHDRHGRIIGFGGRALDEQQKPKYLNSPETAIFQKNRELYGLYHVLKHEIKSIVIVEGYMDVIALSQFGINNAVATLGTATSSYHIQLLSKHTQKLIFCFDGDTAGNKAAWRALENSLSELHTGITAYFVFLPPEHDPDSLIRTEGLQSFNQRLENATPLHTFFFNTLMADLDHTTMTGKSKLITLAKEYFSKMSDGPYKQLMIEELSRITHIESHRVNQLVDTDAQQNIFLDSTKTIVRTPIRMAIAILLQHPEIYTECAPYLDPSQLDAEKHQILQQLITSIQNNPQITTAMLIESWRNTAMFDALNKLIAWEHLIPEENLAKEFLNIINFLTEQTQKQFIQQCIEKARHQQLTEKERYALQAMLKQRHIRNI